MLRVLSRNRKRAATLILLLVVVLVAAGCGGPKEVAEVNGQKITRTQLDDYINGLRFLMPQLDAVLSDKESRAEWEEDILESMISNLLIKEAVAAKGLSVSSEEIDADYEEFRFQILMMMMQGQEDEFAARLKELKITEDTLKNLLSINTYVEKLYEHLLLEVSDEEVRNFLSDNPGFAMMPAMIEPSHILLDTEEDALIARSRILDGEDFGDLAQELSTEPAAQMTRGYLDEIILGSGGWDMDFMNAAAELEVGEISMPVETQFGWHLIILHSRTDVSELSFEEVRDTAADAIVSEKLDAYFTMLRDEAVVKVKL
jgi:foldase protein PrsA